MKDKIEAKIKIYEKSKADFEQMGKDAETEILKTYYNKSINICTYLISELTWVLSIID